MLGFQDLLTIIGALFDATASALVAMFYGFAAFPSGIGFAIGALAAVMWGLCTPISFQAETIVLVGGLGRDIKERLSIVVIAGVIMGVLGAFGLLGATLDFIGETILAGMLAGVGIILARAGVTLAKEHIPSGVVSFAIALSVYFSTQNLAYMIASSIVGSTLVYVLLRRTNRSGEGVKYETEERLVFRRPAFNSAAIWRGALAVCCLQIGGNISYGTITSQIAQMPPPIDKLTVMSAAADVGSALFGGSPIESIISATAAAPHPVLAAQLFMGLMAIILFTRLLPKIAEWVPVSATAGYLFVLGAILVVPDNMAAALSGNPLVGSITAVVTAISDPFIGMIAGILARMVIG
ncbi:MAG TPA: NCS2 family permease [Clostridia bacterium]|nr:NCS2 family permease [Clostridia bacterium]